MSKVSELLHRARWYVEVYDTRQNNRDQDALLTDIDAALSQPAPEAGEVEVVALERFDIDPGGFLGETGHMEADPTGEWVRYSGAQSVIAGKDAEIERLRGLIDGDNCANPDKIDALFRRAEAAEASANAAEEALNAMGQSLLKATQMLTRRSHAGSWWNDHPVYEVVRSIQESHPAYVADNGYGSVIAGSALSHQGGGHGE